MASMGEKSYQEDTHPMFEVLNDILPTCDGKWFQHDCIDPATEESKTDNCCTYTETVPRYLCSWPYNPKRRIPFKSLVTSYPEYNFCGYLVYIIDGFLTTLPNSKIVKPSRGTKEKSVPIMDNYDRSHLVPWHTVRSYNLNVYGTWRSNNIGTFFIDVKAKHYI